ncbi:MAG: hypothetical protein GVY23_07670 [Spirochaetes bacterium]|nr:hypothetical protein [Spirochaetota bacterium]
MNDIIGLLESELEAAFEVRDKQSLHRYVVLMIDRFAARESEEEHHSRLERKMDEGFAEIKDDVRTIAATMKEGFARVDERFEAVDKRFEAVDKRFDDMNKRFNSLVVLMSVFFTVLAGMMTALRLFG